MMMLSVTPTKLSDYLICPAKFKYKHLDRIGSFTSSAAFSFGTSMHHALQKIHSENKIDSRHETPAELLRKFWEKSAYPTKDEEEQYFSKGCRALENYINEIREANEETLGTEIYMSLVLDLKKTKVRLGCRVDRLALHPDQTLEIVDYKTNRSGKVPTAESLVKDLPSFLYFVLTKLTYPQYSNIRLSYLNVLSMEKVSVGYEREIIDENKRMLWKCLKDIAGGIHDPRMSGDCSWCDFQDCCPATSKSADFRKI